MKTHPDAHRTARLLLVTVILLGGAWLRFSHLDWDSLLQLHPDERAILFVAETIATPADPLDVLRPRLSPLNPLRDEQGAPRLYPYGHLPLYAHAAAGWMLGGEGEVAFNRLTLTGRALSALVSTLTLAAMALLARRLFGGAAELVAPALGAVAVLSLQQAHFGVVDTWLTLFSTLAVWLLARYADTGQPRDSLLAGVCIGLAVGSKASGALLIAPLLAAYFNHRRGRDLALSLAGAGLAFALTNPYALLDPAPFVQAVGTQAAMASGALDWPFTRQYIGTLPVIYHVEQQARWALGLPLTLAAYGGLVWASIRAVQTRRRALIVALVWAWAMLLVVGTQAVKFPRYMLPVLPTLIVLGGGLLAAPGRAWLRAALTALVLVPTALYALAFVRMYAQPHPWLAASRWTYANLQPGTVLIAEAHDDVLPLDLVGADGMWLRARLYDVRRVDPFAEPDDEAKLDALLADLAAADAIILASNRAYSTVARLDTRYPLTAEVYHALFDGELGYTLETTFERYPSLFGVTLYDDPYRRAGLPFPAEPPPPALNLGFADESLTVYDHPRVLVFRNDARLTAEEMRAAVLGGASR